MKHANLVSHAKAAAMVAVNVVVDATNAVTTRPLPSPTKPRWPMATQPRSVSNRLNQLSPQTLQHKATNPPPAKTRLKNARPANAAAVTVMVASAVNVVTVPSQRQSRQLTPTQSPLKRPAQLCS